MSGKKFILSRDQEIGKRWVMPIFLLLLSVGLLASCSNEPELLEVTRVVSEQVPVTVEVVQVTTVEVPVEVPIEVTVEVPVEVTRLVEVMLSPTPIPTEEATAVATDAATLVPTATAVAGSATYTVQAGDTLSAIATLTGVSIADIREANGLTSQSLLQTGQELSIPGWDGVPRIVPTVVNSAPTATAAAAQPTLPSTAVGANLLPNPSFEDEWYFFNNINELQIPVGWSTFVDEGFNTLTADPEDKFLRPEIRVVPARDLPPNEVNLFIFDGENTIKAFKGGAPTSFGIYTDIALPAGSYRFTIHFFADIVSIYQDGQKVWATDPDAAEVRIILNDGGTAWGPVDMGMQNTRTYEFSLSAPATVRLGAAFRNRYVNSNNGWFLDDWSLQRLDTP